MKKTRLLALAVILASGTMTVMTGSIIAPVVNLMRNSLGASASSVGLVITTHSLFMALASPFMGSLIDRKGIKAPFVVGLFIYGLAGGAGVYLENFGLLLASRAILGIALAAFFAATNTLILNMFEDVTRVRIMGWHGSAQSLGGVIWPMVGGALGAISWHMPFGVYLVAIPIGLVALAGIPKGVAGPREANRQEETTVLRVFRQKPVLFIICSLMFFINFHLYAIVIYLPQLLETYGISSSFKISLFITAITASAGVISFYYWRFRAHLSYRAIVITAVAIDTAAYLLISCTTHIPTTALSVALFGIGMAFIIPTCMLWIGDLVPPSFRGRFTSYLLMIGFVAQFLSPLIFAPVVSRFGLKAVFLTGSGTCLLWLVALLIFRRLMRPEPSTSAP
jgi:MFS family permease